MKENSRKPFLKIKKIILTIALCVNITTLFAQEFLIREYDDIEIKLDEALRRYEHSRLEFLNVFSNDMLLILLGDKDKLNNKIDIFSLAQLNNQYLRFLRNMIFAQYGYKFNSADLNNYFSKFDWYKPSLNNVDDRLTATDKYNIQLIQTFESRNENQPDIHWNNDSKIGVWQVIPIEASGWSSRFVIHSTNKLEYYYSQMRELDIIRGINGTYTIKGNVLTWYITEIYFIIDCIELDWSGAFGFEFTDTKQNTIRLEKPIVYKFPISNITNKRVVDFWGNEHEKSTITIGIDFYKMSDDVNNKF